MTRSWWLYDAENQCAFKSARKIVNYLQGKHKPIYHPLSKLFLDLSLQFNNWIIIFLAEIHVQSSCPLYLFLRKKQVIKVSVYDTFIWKLVLW